MFVSYVILNETTSVIDVIVAALITLKVNMSPAVTATEVHPETGAFALCALESVGLLPVPMIDAAERSISITILPDWSADKAHFFIVPVKGTVILAF